MFPTTHRSRAAVFIHISSIVTLIVLIRKQMIKGITLLDIITYKILSVLTPRRNHYSRLPIKVTVSIKLGGRTFQVNTRIIVT